MVRRWRRGGGVSWLLERSVESGDAGEVGDSEDFLRRVGGSGMRNGRAGILWIEMFDDVVGLRGTVEKKRVIIRVPANKE